MLHVTHAGIYAHYCAFHGAVGHSLGGLISRYALGMLCEHPLAENLGAESKLHWHSITTMCTPHLGVRKPGCKFAIIIMRHKDSSTRTQAIHTVVLFRFLNFTG